MDVWQPDPLDAFIEQFTPADPGDLLAVAAEYHPDEPAHVAAWAEVHAAAAAEETGDAIDRLRRRVAEWATRGTGVTLGHLGAGPSDELLRVARTGAAGAIVDAGVVEMLGDRLTDEATRALLRAWGLPEMDEDDATAGPEGTPPS
jgi:hypothetical protein